MTGHLLLAALKHDNQGAEIMPESNLRQLSPTEAYDMLHKNPRAVLIDVRSTTEFLLVGHPLGAVHIPWIDEPDWLVDPHFVTNVRKVLLGGIAETTEPSPVLLICRSGKRSADAGIALLKAGFREVYNVMEGFEGNLDESRHRGTTGGWRFHGLPWEQT